MGQVRHGSATRRHPAAAGRLPVCVAADHSAPDTVSAAPMPPAARHLPPAGHRGDKPQRQRFKRYPIGFFHINIAEVQTAEGKLYLFVGIDRTSKFAVTQLVDKADRRMAWEFLEHLLKAVPYRIHTILTDNGIQFAEQPRNQNTAWSRQMRLDMICKANAIEHRLTKPNHPWTNGQVERINRTINEATPNASTTKTTSNCGRTSPTSWPPTTSPVGSRRPAVSRLTNTSPRSGPEPDRFIVNPIHQMPGLNT